MCKREYNGWAGGYDTWAAHLLITNESWETTLEATRAAQRGTDTLKEWFQDTFLTNPETGDYCYGNLAVQQFVESALSEVDWDEVAEALVSNYANEVEGNDDE